MDSIELEKSKAHKLEEIIEYLPGTSVSKTIIKKITGNITASSFDLGEGLSPKPLPYDSYIQIIAGSAEVNINEMKHIVSCGEGIIIPANAKHQFKAVTQFKMLSTIIKSGYED
ncbi:MAG: cupin [Bacteroidetes bacterium]|nr:cupin [Bacteroidota bacterium]